MTISPFQASRLYSYGESVFDEWFRLAQHYAAVNLAAAQIEGEEPAEIVEAAQRAMADGHNQHALRSGEHILNTAIADHTARFYGQSLDPVSEITVVSGATEGIWCATQAFVEPGSEVIVFEPFYESYRPSIEMAGGRVVTVPLHAPDFGFDPDEFRAAFSPRTRAILVNTPHNPTGHVFSYAELSCIATCCQEFDVLAIIDEVYEHLVFDDAHHHRLATLPDMWERTLTISSASKTFSVTGWRIGWVIGPAALQEGVRLVHQFAVLCSPTPLQYAIATGLRLPASYFTQLATTYQARRDFLWTHLVASGLCPICAQGGYGILTDIRQTPFTNAYDFCHYLVSEIGVAALPLDVFYLNRDCASNLVRFTFCKDWNTLESATQRLQTLRT